MLPQIQQHLDGLRMKLQPRKCQVLPVRCGVLFLGWQVFPDHRRLRRKTGVRFQRRLAELRNGYAGGTIAPGRIRMSIASWIGHLSHGDARGLVRRLLAQSPFVRRRPPVEGALR